MAEVMPAVTSPFNADPEQTPPMTKKEMKNQSDSSEGPIMMIENATDFRPDSRKKNVRNFPVQLFPVDSWQKFEDAYIKGQTNDHLHYVFDQMGVADKLGKGVFRLKLSIHVMPHCDTETGDLIAQKKEILNGMWDMYLEELDLMPLAKEIGEKVLDRTSRRENVEFLLKRLFCSKGINVGSQILKEFCATYPFITKRISDIMGKRAEDENLLGQELFTAVITLDIIMTESTGDMKMNIVVEDPKLHYDTFEDARKAVSSAGDHQIIGALLDIDCYTTKENEEDADMEGSSDDVHTIVAIYHDSDCDTTKKKATTRDDADKEGSSANISRILAFDFEDDFNTTKETDTTRGKLHQNVLNRCLSVLVKDVDIERVSIYIQQEEIFDFVTLRDILEQPTTTKKITELIKQIQLRDQDAYNKFKECLVQAKQGFLKVMLEEEEAKEIKEKRPMKRKRSLYDDDAASSVPS